MQIYQNYVEKKKKIVEYIMTAEKEENEDSFKLEECIIAEKEEDEDSFKPEECIIDDESGKVDFNYKRKAIQFWKDEKKACRGLTNVQSKFRKVKSTIQVRDKYRKSWNKCR